MRKSLVLLFAILLSVPLLAAQTPGTRPPTDIEVLAQFDPVAIADYRATLVDILTMDVAIVASTGQAVTAAAMERRIDVVRNTPDADIARLMATGVSLTELRDQTAALRDQSAQPARQLRIATNSAGFPDADYSFLGSTHNSTEAMFAAQTVLDQAKAVWAGLSRACDEVIVILGEGGNGSLACIVVDIVLYEAEAAYRAVEFIDDEIDSNEINGSYRRLGHLHTDLVSAESSIISNDDGNTNSILNNDDGNMNSIITNDDGNTLAIVTNDDGNTADIIANDNANKDTIVTTDNTNALATQTLINQRLDEQRALFLREAIEENLQAGDPKQVALFMLPAEFGGYLELVNEIVLDSINKMAAAGMNIHEARTRYNEAQVKLAVRNFKETYKKLCAAYNEMAKY